MTRAEAIAWRIVLGQANGRKFDWDAMDFEKLPDPPSPIVTATR